MATIPFVKYQGTGNDFILIDARQHLPNLDVAQLCHRHFGIGADGLMYLINHPTAHFEMVYYNSDGNISSMCGNGGRCIAHFASTLGIGNELQFKAADGMHQASVNGSMVNLSMNNVEKINAIDAQTFELNTGSPHYVQFIDSPVQQADLIKIAHAVRYSTHYAAQGINVNIVNTVGKQLHVRTYERGVENETLSCGTGVTACALAYLHKQAITGTAQVQVHSPGGMLQVSTHAGDSYTHIQLTGPATPVFSGTIAV